MLQFELESHGQRATLYVSGSLSLPGLWELMGRVGALPDEIRDLRVDLRSVRMLQEGVMEALASALSVWRVDRGGSTRVELPPAGLGGRVIGAQTARAEIVHGP